MLPRTLLVKAFDGFLLAGIPTEFTLKEQVSNPGFVYFAPLRAQIECPSLAHKLSILHLRYMIAP